MPPSSHLSVTPFSVTCEVVVIGNATTLETPIAKPYHSGNKMVTAYRDFVSIFQFRQGKTWPILLTTNYESASLFSKEPADENTYIMLRTSNSIEGFKEILLLS